MNLNIYDWRENSIVPEWVNSLMEHYFLYIITTSYNFMGERFI